MMDDRNPFMAPANLGSDRVRSADRNPDESSRIVKIAAIVVTLVALAAMLFGVANTSLWYLNLFYREPWFETVFDFNLRQQMRAYFTKELRRTAFPLVLTNMLTLVVMWIALTHQRASK